MKETCPQLENCRVTYLDGDGKLGESFEAMRRHLRTQQGAAACSSARSTIRARSARCARSRKPAAPTSCAIMGQNASPEGRAELREPGTRLIGSVAYFPGEVRRRDRRRRARHPSPPAGAAGGVREAPARHAGERQPRLPERRVDAAAGRADRHKTQRESDRQRRNASGSPPSTGITWPVVLAL